MSEERELYQWAEYIGFNLQDREMEESYKPHTLTLKRHFKNRNIHFFYRALKRIMDKCAETGATQEIYQKMLQILEEEEYK